MVALGVKEVASQSQLHRRWGVSDEGRKGGLMDGGRTEGLGGRSGRLSFG